MDTSFLLFIVSEPVDPIKDLEGMLGKVELLLLEDTMKELHAISRGTSVKKSKWARLALKLAVDIEQVHYREKGSTDDKILMYARENRLIVAAMDRGLIRRLRANSIPIVTYRGRRVVLEGGALL